MCGCALKASFASTPARSIILATPAVLKGAPRSEVNTKGDFGSCSHCSRRSARTLDSRRLALAADRRFASRVPKLSLLHAARLTSAHSPEVAGEFIDFLSSPQARKEFIASGAE